MNLEWTFVLFTHFGVTTGITQGFRVIPEVTPKWVNNTNVHSKFTLISLFSKIHSLKSEHIHSFLFREYTLSRTRLLERKKIRWNYKKCKHEKNLRNCSHYVTVVFNSRNIILVSPHIHRTEICWILPSVRRRLRNMIEGAGRPVARYASHLLMLLLSP